MLHDCTEAEVQLLVTSLGCDCWEMNWLSEQTTIQLTHTGTFLLKSLRRNFESKITLQITPTAMNRWEMTSDNEENSSVTNVQIKDQEFFSYLS